MSEKKTVEGVWSPANKVTMARILLIPVFVAALVGPWPYFFPEWMDMPTAKPWIAAAIFIVLSATDSLDGYLARSRGEVTDFGKFMDPLADKLLVTAALLGLVELFVIPSWVALIIIVREFIVSGVRMIAASNGEVIAASWYGKVKTVLQMVAIVLFIVKDSHVITDIYELLYDWLYIFSWFVMICALIMTVLSMFDYLYKARYLLGFTDRGSSGRSKRAKVKAIDESTSSRVYQTIEEAATAVVTHAKEKGIRIATAESCTGGLISGAITAIPGSSEVIQGAVVSYSNDVKHNALGVEQEALDTYGAVSEQVACQMASGVRIRLKSDIAVSVTGIAGPGGGTNEKPVGTVWIGLATPEGGIEARHHVFEGSRDTIRQQSVLHALTMLDEAIMA